MLRLISVGVLIIFLLSCNKKPKELSITFVFDKPLSSSSNKYPQYFLDISTPFSSKCGGDYLLKPISVCRLDISNKIIETNAWYFKDLGENTVEFSKPWLEQYFRDSLISNYLVQPSLKEADIEKWIANNKDSVYIYSEESDSKNYNGKMVFNNAKELNEKLQEVACSNSSGKIVILVNPQIMQADNSPINNSSVGDCTSLQKVLTELINSSNYAEKTAAEGEALLYLATKFSVLVKGDDSNSDVADKYENGEEYLKKLTADLHLTDIEVSNCKWENGKITYFEVKEKRKKDIDTE